jgi:2-(1,2-epoxy-1,2-dihydrophenyl)acetyl-CoA isomerase
VSEKAILVEEKGKISIVTLNRPDKLNALDLIIREELKSELRRIDADENCKIIVITGEGKAFCAGGDIKTMEKYTATAGRRRLKNLQELLKIITDTDKIVIAAVNGYAMGVGLSLALACDIIIASDKAKFSLSFIKIGLIPDMGSLFFLPLRIGVPKAKELMLSGRTFDAKEAVSMGMINRVVSHEHFISEVMKTALDISKGPHLAHAMIKNALSLWPYNLPTLLELESNLQGISLTTEDLDEGMQAFLQKREPEFTGR